MSRSEENHVSGHNALTVTEAEAGCSVAGSLAIVEDLEALEDRAG
jgi:hypothetical protein